MFKKAVVITPICLLAIAGIVILLVGRDAKASAVTQYSITPTANVSRAPKTWTFQGSANNTAWTTLDTQVGEIFTASTKRTFTCTTAGNYRHYQLLIYASNGDANYVEIADVEIIQNGTTDTCPVMTSLTTPAPCVVSALSLLGQEAWYAFDNSTTSYWSSIAEIAPARLTTPDTLKFDFVATPTTTSITPTSKISGDAGFTLTVNGTNFLNGTSTVMWNRSPRITTYVSATQLTATIPAIDITTAGTASVTVYNAGAGWTSLAKTFTTNNPLPTATAITSKSGVRTNNLLSDEDASFAGGAWTDSELLLMDGTTAIKDEISNTAFTMTGTSGFQTLLGKLAPTLSTSKYTSCNIENTTIGLTAGMPISIMAVVNTTGIQWNDEVPHLMFITRDSAACNGGFELCKSAYGYLVIGTWLNGAEKWTAVVLTAANWAPGLHRVLATIDSANNQRIFLDGVEGTNSQGSCARETVLGTSSYVGIHDDGVFPLNGSILVAMWSRVLSTPEIMRLSSLTSWANLSFPVPTTTSISPTSKISGDAGFTLTVNGSNFVNTSVVRWNGVDKTTAFGNSGQLTATIPAGDIATTGTASVTVFNPTPGGGTSNAQTFVVNAPPVPPADQWKSTFYFAEGYTGQNFQEYTCIGNPNTAPADAWVTCMFTDGTSQSQYYSLEAVSRLTVDINQLAGVDKELSMRVVSTSPGIVAERPMYFNYNGVWTGGSDAVGAVAPNTKWYFAEGNTLPEFDQYVTVLNPGSTKANLKFHYMVEGQGEEEATGSVGAHARATFKTKDQIGNGKHVSLYLESTQGVVAERPMYFNYVGLAQNNWTGGHDAVGTNSPNTDWYFAEGTTRKNSIDGAFEQWLCLQNPGTAPLTVTATYQLAAGQGNPVSKSYTVPAQQRLTVSVNKEIGQDKDCSVYLHSASNFIAERPMYFSYHASAWTGGHDVLGVNSTATTWFFGEGTTRTNFEEWLCLQNPGNSDAHTTIRYFTASGQVITKQWTVKANTRLTVSANTDVGANQDISTKVSSDKPVIVERPMYFDYNGWTGGHDVVGFVPSQ